MLGAEHEPVSRLFATRGRDEDGVAAHPTEPGPATGVPLLSDALATLECRTVATHPGGDHTVLIGEVLAVRTLRPDGDPLLYVDGRYRGLAG